MGDMGRAGLNLVVVCFDTLRRDAVAGDLCRTPTLDHFAERAVVYTNAWAEGLPTIPFRRAVHTGMRSYPWRHHLGDRGSFPNLLGWHAIPEYQTTLAEHLYRRGYATGLVSDVWHLFKASMNFVRGFVSWDFIRGQEGDAHTLSREAFEDPSPHAGRRIGPAPYLYQTRDRQADEDYFVAQVFDRAADWVEGMQRAGPYFLWVDSFTPHEFWDPPARFADLYCPGEGRGDHIVPQSLNRAPGRPEPDPRDIARTRALYQGYVTFADERLGRFLDRLKRCGALADSVVVILSDHGTELWDQGQFGKSGARLHAYNTQINWLVRHPDLDRRVEVPAWVQNQDVVPTLLDLVGGPHPSVDGGVVWPFASHPAPPRDHVVIGWETHASVREERWNLLMDATEPTAPPRLYDLAADPREEHNVISEHPEVVIRLRSRLEAVLGEPLPARFGHRPAGGFAATPSGLRQVRQRLAPAGPARVAGEGAGPAGPTPQGRWEGSNLV